ncbi:hypothetical protein V7S43_006232 [Phytophthora oleae]|uniref:BZIP domain-containing protein n=1 Tax=Phytophthora oleae TaxID=2107226 RepID=A0ABD3FVC9_9STRA
MTRALAMKDDALIDSMPAELVVDFIQEDPTGDNTEWKRERHRIKMVNFRLRKKQEKKGLRSEWRRLERDMKLLAEDLRRTGDFDLETRATTNHAKMKAIRLFAVLKVALAEQNAVLRTNIQRHHLLTKAMIDVSQIFREDKGTALPRNAAKAGWRVHFPFGEPSFHFHPITRDQFKAAMDSCCAGLLEQPLHVAGECLNWNVQHATVFSQGKDQPFLACARFIKRLQCSLDAAVSTVENDIDRDAWPVIVTPMNFDSYCSSQVLQQFDDNSRVLVRNIFGRVSLRYICLMQRFRRSERGEKQVITFAATIFDSEDNKRSRSAETDQDKVEWVTEGRSVLTLTELDHSSIDVVYDRWGGSQGSLHAQQLIVEWAQNIVQWEQRLLSTGLLSKRQRA